MQNKNTFNLRSFKGALLATAMAAGIAGYSLSASGIAPVSPVLAEPVKLEAPAALSFADVVEAVSPAVVSVRVETEIHPAASGNDFRFDRRDGSQRPFDFREFFHNFPRQPGPDARPNRPHRYGQSQGSGFFVSEDGYVVTNHHVIQNGSKFTVVLNDGSEHEATLVGADERTDLAVLKVEADREFTYVDFGGKAPRIGDWVVAVGNPFGLGGTVTAGIVSAHGREIGANRYDDFIQIDAAVNKGNSGGPAFNLNGEVVGVNTAIFSPSGGNVGIAFAIPASTASEIVDELIDNGRVVRGWLGVQIQPVTADIAEALSLSFENGAIVTSPQNDGPADEAGIRSGDIITKVDGKSVKGPKALARIIGGYEPNAKVEIELWRDGSVETVDVTLGKLEMGQLAATDSGKGTLNGYGLELGQSADGNGVVVLNVEPDSKAARKGIRPGDIIVSVNGEPVAKRQDLTRELGRVGEMGRNAALLQIERDGNTVFVPLPIKRG